jgi:hypothetical protein
VEISKLKVVVNCGGENGKYVAIIGTSEVVVILGGFN